MLRKFLLPRFHHTLNTVNHLSLFKMPRQKRNTGDRDPKDKTRKRFRDASASGLEVPQKRPSGRIILKQSPTVTAGKGKDKDSGVRTLDSLSVERPKRWGIHHPPITNYDNVPVGWSMNEPDIHEQLVRVIDIQLEMVLMTSPYCSDIERQIERCYVRLKEGIMTIIFEKRLIMYQEVKKWRE